MPVSLPAAKGFRKNKYTKCWSCRVLMSGGSIPVGGIYDVEAEREDLLYILRLAERRLESITKKAAKDISRYLEHNMSVTELANDMELASLGYHHDAGLLTMYFHVPENIFGGHDVEIDFGMDESLGPAGLTG